jgi:hypothetical protein
LRVKELHLFVGKDVDLIEYPMQLPTESAVLLVQKGLIKDRLNELALYSDELIQIARLGYIILEDFPRRFKHLDHDVVMDSGNEVEHLVVEQVELVEYTLHALDLLVFLDMFLVRAP